MGRKNTQIESMAKELVGDISKTISVNGVFLFGSYARGDERKDSDVDLVVLSPDFEKMDFIERMILLSRMRSGKALDYAMDLIGYTPDEFETIDQESAIMRQAKKEGYFVWKKED